MRAFGEVLTVNYFEDNAKGKLKFAKNDLGKVLVVDSGLNGMCSSC
ncbi:MAG: regulator of RNase E activity RraA [Cognaticolwellia sp.]|jgi:regulator of RNase E activity RraA